MNIINKFKAIMKADAKMGFKKLGVFGACFAYAAVANAQKGAGAITKATTEFSSYLNPVQKLLYAIAAIIALVGAFTIFAKMQNGDQDVKKSIMMTIGGCVAFVALATSLPLFFQ